MNTIFLLPILLIQLLFNTNPKETNSIVNNTTTVFPDTEYSKYDYKTFAKNTEANKEIEINTIDYDLLNAAVFFATNQQRVNHNLSPFTFNPLLRNAATLHTEQMVKLNFFAHQNPKNKELKTLKERLAKSKAEGSYHSAGENISEYFLLNYTPNMYYTMKVTNGKKVFVNPKTGKPIISHTYLSFGEAIVADWMTSPGHRANILNPGFTHLGCSGIKSTPLEAFPKAKVTQVFGNMR